MKQLTAQQVEALRSVPLGELPNRLIVARRMLGVDQVTLAVASKLSQPTISDAESGRPIKLPTAQAIALAIGAGVDDIFPARQSSEAVA